MSSYPNAPVEQRFRWKPMLLIVAGILVIGAIYVFTGREEKLATMSAGEAHLAAGPGAAEPAKEFDRSQNPEIYYHVVLRGAPLGWGLELNCQWTDPTGRTARHNVYETRFIHKSIWPTHCRQQFGPSVPAGEWTVSLLMGDRLLSTSSFTLK